MRLFIVTLFLLLRTAGSYAELVREPFEGVRQTGMGNAFIALADDANTLFYNPAGLANVKGAHFNLFNFTHATDSSDSSKRFYDAIFNGKASGLIRRDTQYVGLSTMPTFVVPNFGVALYTRSQGFFDIQDLASTGIDVYAFNDLGLQMGFSIPMGEYFSVGVAGRAVERTGVDARITPQQIVDAAGIDPNTFLDNIYAFLKDMAGTGYGFGLDAGVLMRIPTLDKQIRLTVGATVNDFNDTVFRKIGDTPVPPPVKQSYHFGTALQIPVAKNIVWNNTLDMRHQLQGLPFLQGFHFGSELRHKIFGIRAGVYQGYATGGLSIEFPPHTRLHFSTYAVEIGGGMWQRQQRWYLAQLVIGFNPF